jgi:DNA-binding protein H-NS
MDKTMKPDLDNYTLEELTSLKKDVEAAINSFNARALAHAREELEKTAKSMGYKLDEIFEMRKPRAKVAPKYRNSDDQDQTWTGRGRKPKWVEYALQSGKTLEDLRI